MNKPYIWVMEGYVRSIVDENGIGTIEFFHPAHNSLPGYLLASLEEEIQKLSQDDGCEVIILKSGGDRTFCAGASFDELLGITDASEGKMFFSGFANVINAMRKCQKLFIGRVQGKAVGGGVGIASAVDYCFATKFASVKLSELGIGIGPFVIGPAVQRKIGLSAFTELTLTFTRFFDYEWCSEKGLYHQVFNDAREMDVAILKFAKELARTNPEARKACKRIFWEGTDHWDQLLEYRAAESGRLVLSDFTKKTLAQIKSQ
ncbi:enoyl-CoA hydratase/isomerase family protein [Portibacter marinus]|uniref:enoyl-CoA hydratase/isomerase family protein n=1 Tax=Portibacter marinus TaxID=2898660 RepID=UPI001F389C5C|nr:enoyl-CoA hydratase/isomerase family protein [Portibacter marinus]